MEIIVTHSMSGDPFTRGHDNIGRKAKKEFGIEPYKLLVYNPEKDKGLLTIAQRYKDMVITLLSYGINDGSINHSNLTSKLGEIKKYIIIATTPQEIHQVMNSSDYLIRGIRDDVDYKYSLQLLEKYGNPERITKSRPIYQDPQYCNMSSTKYKLAFAQRFSGTHQLPQVYNFIDIGVIYQHCTNLLEKHGEDFDRPDLISNIQEYCDLVNNLEKKGRFKYIKI